MCAKRGGVRSEGPGSASSKAGRRPVSCTAASSRRLPALSHSWVMGERFFSPTDAQSASEKVDVANTDGHITLALQSSLDETSRMVGIPVTICHQPVTQWGPHLGGVAMSMIEVGLLTDRTHPFDQMIGGTTTKGLSRKGDGIMPSLSFLHSRNEPLLRLEFFFPIHGPSSFGLLSEDTSSWCPCLPIQYLYVDRIPGRASVHAAQGKVTHE
jgi:hypothetical protein